MPTLLSEAFPSPIWNKEYYSGATRTNGARWNSLVNKSLNKGAHNSGIVMNGPHSFSHHKKQSDIDDLFNQQQYAKQYSKQHIVQQEYLNDLRQLHNKRQELFNKKQKAQNAPKLDYMTHVYHALAREAYNRMIAGSIDSNQSKTGNSSWINSLDKDNIIIALLCLLIIVILVKRH